MIIPIQQRLMLFRLGVTNKHSDFELLSSIVSGRFYKTCNVQSIQKVLPREMVDNCKLHKIYILEISATVEYEFYKVWWCYRNTRKAKCVSKSPSNTRTVEPRPFSIAY
jgi:hypothetical protein